MRRHRNAFASLAVLAAVACSAPLRDATTNAGDESPYLLISAGDKDEADSDFLAVIDLRTNSPTLGKVIVRTRWA